MESRKATEKKVSDRAQENRMQGTAPQRPLLKTKPDRPPVLKTRPDRTAGETEEQRRERVRQARGRKELQKKRMRKKKLIRLLVYILIGVLAVLLIFALVAIAHRVQSGRQERAVEEARQEEITNSVFYTPAEVLHLSFPVLTLDDTGSGLSVSQFQLILEDLYTRGYVLVDPYSLAENTKDGFTAGQIMVPSGKKPMILSQYDVSYEPGDTEHAVSLSLDASGKLGAGYIDASGFQVTGDTDVVPALEAFLKEHPDFSYKNARGILGVTGYRGVLGYAVEKDAGAITTVQIEETEQQRKAREAEENSVYGDVYGYTDYGYTDTGYTDAGYTDAGYADTGYVDETAGYGYADGAAFAAKHPQHVQAADAGANGTDVADASENTDVAGASEDADTAAEETDEEDLQISKNKKTIEAVLSALRSSGWYIASGSYGMVSYGSSAEMVTEDAERWVSVVAPLVGGADMILLPGNADIGQWSGYTESNAKYVLLKEQGFKYFFVGDDASMTWAQVRSGYVRQGMHRIPDYAAYLALMSGNGTETGSSDAFAAETADGAGDTSEDGMEEDGSGAAASDEDIDNAAEDIYGTEATDGDIYGMTEGTYGAEETGGEDVSGMNDLIGQGG